MSDAIDATPDGMRLSDWITLSPVVKATAYALMKALSIEPVKVRQVGISRPVSWLNAEMVAAMDAAVERLQGGATVAEIAASPDGHGQLQPAAHEPSLAQQLHLKAMFPTPSPLTRARELQQAAAEGLMLTTAELALLTGVSIEAMARLRSGMRLKGYRVVKVPGSVVDPEPVWRLTAGDAEGRD